MELFQKSGSLLIVCLFLCMVDSRAGIAGNVRLVAMNGNQYWFSSSSPYAPSLNFHLAYQYCRTLGLQLVVLETKEEVEAISGYLNSDESSSNTNLSKYWTSGNKLGSNSWIWMSTGEQMNSSFSDYWLKNANGSPTDNPRHCMSMKAPITKRAIFTAEECSKSLPFICEQVRCLYYNYPVTLFPDPSGGPRTDIEDGTISTPTEVESRSSLHTIYNPNEQIRAQNYISGNARNILLPSKNNKLSQFSDTTAEESGRIDSSKIQRRITLRPVMTTYPYPPSYINSFYKYKSVDYSLTSTNKPSFKKTTRETLWGPSSNFNQLNPGTPPTDDLDTSSGRVSTTINKIDNGRKSTIFITGKVLRPSNSTVATSVQSSISTTESKPTTYTHLEIVTSKSTSIDGKEVPNSEENEGPTTAVYNARYGTGMDEFSTNNPSIVFDDEQNNVGSEVEIEDGTTLSPLLDDSEARTMFYEGNGIRRPDTKPSQVTENTQIDEETTTTTTFKGNRELSQVHSPATMKLYQFQRAKHPITSWSRNGKSNTVTTIIANTNSGPAKIGLGPRLKFNLRRH